MTELTQKILEYIQKRHRLDILLAMYDGDKKEYSWRDFRGWHLSDKTFREAMHDLESLGLVKRIPLSSIHNRYTLTEKGVLIASVFHETVRNLDALTKTFEEGK